MSSKAASSTASKKRAMLAESNSDDSDGDDVIAHGGSSLLGEDGQLLVASHFVKNRGKKASRVWDYIGKLSEDRCQCLNPKCGKVFEHRIFRHADRVEKHVFGMRCDVAYEASIGKVPTETIALDEHNANDATETAFVVTSHVIDSSLGTPVPGLSVKIAKNQNVHGRDEWKDIWVGLAENITDEEGRVQFDFMGKGGVYKLVFYTEKYLRKGKKPAFFPKIEVLVHIADGSAPIHVPLLLSPFGYSTYKGN